MPTVVKAGHPSFLFPGKAGRFRSTHEFMGRALAPGDCQNRRYLIFSHLFDEKAADIVVLFRNTLEKLGARD